MNKTEKVVYEDIYFLVKYTYNKEEAHFLDFVATKITGLIGSKEDEIELNELDKYPLLKGRLKWDGCMDIQMQEGYIHFCGRYETKQFSDLFNKLYDKAKELGFDDCEFD